MFSINTRQSFVQTQISYTNLDNGSLPKEIIYPGLKLQDSEVNKKARKLMEQRVALHYEFCRRLTQDVEQIPYDYFWEEPILRMNLKPAQTKLQGEITVDNACWFGEKLLEMDGHAAFCPLANIQLSSVVDQGLGLVPKSLLALPNGDIVLGTFSVRKGYAFKVFQTHPFRRVDQKKGYFSQYDCKLTCEKNPGLYFLEPSQVGRGFADPKSAASIHYEPADGALMGKPGKNYRKDYNDVGGF